MICALSILDRVLFSSYRLSRSDLTSSIIPKKQHHSPASTEGLERNPKTTPSSGATTCDWMSPYKS